MWEFLPFFSLPTSSSRNSRVARGLATCQRFAPCRCSRRLGVGGRHVDDFRWFFSVFFFFILWWSLMIGLAYAAYEWLHWLYIYIYIRYFDQKASLLLNNSFTHANSRRPWAITLNGPMDDCHKIVMLGRTLWMPWIWQSFLVGNGLKLTAKPRTFLLETSSNGACFGGMLMKQTGKHCGGFKGVLRF